MRKRIAPGFTLAIIGLALFAYLGIGQTVRKHVADAGVALRSAHGMQVNDPPFPVGSLLAGFLLMSGISLVAIGAQQGFKPHQSDAKPPEKLPKA
ncbi:MAG: hypothetical protein ACRD59_14880 [Candidatus Acidiferrales bacterium]